MHHAKFVLLILAAILLFSACQRTSTPVATTAPATATSQHSTDHITKNLVVYIDYTLTDPMGQVIDTSIGKTPLPYIHGHGNFIRGLEWELEGKSKGDTFKVTIQPESAYGLRDEKLVQVVPKSNFKGVTDFRVGMKFRSQAGAPVTVTNVGTDTLTIDANHPLAGVPLTFDVTVKDIRQATLQEIAEGVVHGPAH